MGQQKVHEDSFKFDAVFTYYFCTKKKKKKMQALQTDSPK